MKNPHWTNDDCERISKRIGLSEGQVYKWNWDQKKKLNIIPNKVYILQMPQAGVKQGGLEGHMVNVNQLTQDEQHRLTPLPLK
jgi:hypothetical protein